MTEEELQNYEKELNISKDQILREEVEVIILNELANSKISQSLVFYGGTSLRLAYGSPRFSEDIDLVCIKNIKFEDFEIFLKEIIKKNKNWKIGDLKDKRNTMFALVVIDEEKLKHNFSIKIEINKPTKKIKLDTELLLIKSYLSILCPLLMVPKLEELKRLKIEALQDRKKARDIFDLWFISNKLKENFVLPKNIPTYMEKEFKNELQVFLPKKYYSVIKQLYEQTIK